MNKYLKRLLLATAVLSFSSAVGAQETEFLKSLAGKWSGKGMVKVRVNASPMTVSCKFASDATASSLSLDGNCTGMLVFSRVIGAHLTTNGVTYSGSYIGAGTGTAGLTGKRSGNAIDLGIRWAKDVNGDREAQMKIEKIGATGMRLTTVDTDPKTGKSVLTSQIDLRRL